jgi:hypothetical protein
VVRLDGDETSPQPQTADGFFKEPFKWVQVIGALCFIVVSLYKLLAMIVHHETQDIKIQLEKVGIKIDTIGKRLDDIGNLLRDERNRKKFTKVFYPSNIFVLFW